MIHMQIARRWLCAYQVRCLSSLLLLCAAQVASAQRVAPLGVSQQRADTRSEPAMSLPAASTAASQGSVGRGAVIGALIGGTTALVVVAAIETNARKTRLPGADQDQVYLAALILVPLGALVGAGIGALVAKAR
jgi:hypothetical protein